MVIRLRTGFSALAAVAAAVSIIRVATERVLTPVALFGLALIDALATPIEDLRRLFDEPDQFATGGAPLDAALQHSLRHEAGVSRRAAARHI